MILKKDIHVLFANGITALLVIGTVEVAPFSETETAALEPLKIYV